MNLTLPKQSEMYQALQRRDAAYDGVFIVAVRTTGIFCRPTCPSRKPLETSVEYFRAPSEALLAGYRPCKRCRPMEAHGKPPEWAKRLIERVDDRPQSRLTAADLRACSIEPARASRWFKRNYGMTFQAYSRARRMGMALAALREGREIGQVGSRHGFGSESGFREAFHRTFGRPPGEASHVDCLLARWIDTPLGAMLAAANDEGLGLLEFVDRRMLQTQIETLRRRFDDAAIVPGSNRHLDSIEQELRAYFEGSLRRFSTPLVLRGTDFQVKAWRRLMEIPYGATTSYARMASDIGAAGAQRAVGKANGDNRLAIVIPCHRVVKSDGELCGYGGGLWRKKWLLEHETNALEGRNAADR